tara:strand:+ start:98655 stop:99926 length:1272 start_codon:yes stop_codon:yes gene_type:complete
MRKNRLWYQFFRMTLVKNGLRFFYKKIIVNGKEKLPKNKPLLLVPNHQNSFMDAFLVATNAKPITYFLTRAQAFKNPLQAKFIRSINLLPVYRVRDGLSSVSKNNETFEECIKYLKRKDAILVFPEANHNLKRRIRPLSKGFTRIAFDAELQENWEMDLYVIPAGVNYSEHQRSRNIVQVEFGDPIHMKDFKNLYEKDEREATNLLKERVSEQMKKLTMHVTSLDHYALCNILIDDLEDDVLKLINPKIANENIAKIEAKLTPEIVEIADSVSRFAEKHNFKIKTFLGRKSPRTAMILLFPLYLFSWLNNLIPYQPIRKITTKTIKDHAFDASIKFLLGLLLFPSFWVIIVALLFLIGVPTVYVLGYFILSVLTVVLFKDANLIVREAKEKKKIKFIQNTFPEEFAEFKNGLKKLNEFRAEVL